ncbi:MAG: LysR family transcriptional regulator [Rubrivivax sp.]|jgi:DNA-binding transcriptional LysR family regulator|nr:LysR family transcriptional regulator [Rubrivivax sp.]
MPDRRHVLTPDALAMMDAIARTGSFAAAARELGKVPSALTYNVRQLEEALDVLLFDRSSRQAQPTAAGLELLHEGRRLLQELEAVANRVKRVASGWEATLSISVEDILSTATVFDLVEAFCSLRPEPGATQGLATRLRLRSDVLAGTWEALISGQVDLAIGVAAEHPNPGGVEVRPLGEVPFVFCVAPHHPLAERGRTLSSLPAPPLEHDQLIAHRAVAVADTAQKLQPLTRNLLPGQDVLTVPTMRAKLEALLRGLGCGYLPEPLARPWLAAGKLVRLQTVSGEPVAKLHYAWRAERGPGSLGRALQWWLTQLESPHTRQALIERHLVDGTNAAP